jgi:hypothetical protein
MSPGSAVIHGTTLGILVIGWSWMKLFFRPPGSRFWKNDLQVMTPEERRVAYRCEGCAGLFIEQTPYKAVIP